MYVLFCVSCLLILWTLSKCFCVKCSRISPISISYLSQGSAATHLRCDGQYDMGFVEISRRIQQYNNTTPPVNICQSYKRMYSGTVFTALHRMQTRSSDENLSVCPSVRQTRELWQNERKISPDIYTIRKTIYPSFLRRRMFGGGDPFYPKFWVNRPPLERNRRFWTNNRS